MHLKAQKFLGGSKLKFHFLNTIDKCSHLIYYSGCKTTIDLPLLLSFPLSLSSVHEVNRERSKVNKPWRRSSLTQQPNVKGQRPLGVITRPPNMCVCVSVIKLCFFFSFVDCLFKLHESRISRIGTHTSTQKQHTSETGFCLES